eukprot:Opistho-2@74978
MSVTGARQAADRTHETGSPVKEQVEPAALRTLVGNQAALRRAAPAPPLHAAPDEAVAPPERDEREPEEAEENEANVGGLMPQRMPAPPPVSPPGAGDGGEAPLAAAIRLARAGEGAPLPAAVRGPLERAFARDLGAVRLHQGPAAAPCTLR